MDYSLELQTTAKTLFKLQYTWGAIAIALFWLFITAIWKWFLFEMAFWVTYQEARNIAQYLEFNNNESIPHQNLCDTGKVALDKMWSLEHSCQKTRTSGSKWTPTTTCRAWNISNVKFPYFWWPEQVGRAFNEIIKSYTMSTFSFSNVYPSGPQSS